MACDEAYYRHFHKRQRHAHEHQHEEHHQHQHEETGKAGQTPDLQEHQHDEFVHTHPYTHEDPHHHSEAIQLGVSVYVLENRKDRLLLEDVDLLEFYEDQIVIHNILGNEQRLTACLKRIHFVDRGKVLMLLEKV